MVSKRPAGSDVTAYAEALPVLRRPAMADLHSLTHGASAAESLRTATANLQTLWETESPLMMILLTGIKGAASMLC